MSSEQDQRQHSCLMFLRAGQIAAETFEFDRISLQIFGGSLQKTGLGLNQLPRRDFVAQSFHSHRQVIQAGHRTPFYLRQTWLSPQW